MPPPYIPKMQPIDEKTINNSLPFTYFIEQNQKNWVNSNQVEISAATQNEYETWFKNF